MTKPEKSSKNPKNRQKANMSTILIGSGDTSRNHLVMSSIQLDPTSEETRSPNYAHRRKVLKKKEDKFKPKVSDRADL